jgi:hypothetical protein
MREQHSTSSMTQEILGVLCPCHFIIINTPHHYKIEMYQRNTYFISIKIQIHHVRKYHSTRQNEIFISNLETTVNCISTIRYTCNTIAVISCTKDVHSCPINFVQEGFRNLHESTWWWTMYGKTVFLEEFELNDVTPDSDNACHPSYGWTPSIHLCT